MSVGSKCTSQQSKVASQRLNVTTNSRRSHRHAHADPLFIRCPRPHERCCSGKEGGIHVMVFPPVTVPKLLLPREPSLLIVLLGLHSLMVSTRVLRNLFHPTSPLRCLETMKYANTAQSWLWTNLGSVIMSPCPAFLS